MSTRTSSLSTRTPSGPVVQNAASSRSGGGACGSTVSVSGLTVSFAKAAVSIASAVRPLFGGSAQKVAHRRDVVVGLLDEAQMARVGDNVELAVRDSLVEHTRRARGRRRVVLADDDERRLVDVLQLRAVVEVAVACVGEVT